MGTELVAKQIQGMDTATGYWHSSTEIEHEYGCSRKVQDMDSVSAA